MVASALHRRRGHENRLFAGSDVAPECRDRPVRLAENDASRHEAAVAAAVLPRSTPSNRPTGKRMGGRRAPLTAGSGTLVLPGSVLLCRMVATRNQLAQADRRIREAEARLTHQAALIARMAAD